MKPSILKVLFFYIIKEKIIERSDYMANILYYPQMSMYDKQTKKLLPEADGNINMMRNTINEWKKYRPDDKFFVLIPEGVFLPFAIDLKIDCQYFTYKNYVVSARINRFNFPMNEFSSILKDYKFDLIINDVIELTSNFKQLFNIEFGYTPKIISNIRHLDDVINHQYMHRVIDGIIQSDLVTILSETMYYKLDQQITLLTGGHNITNKVVIFEPSISEKEITKYLTNAKIIDMRKITITFPGRLAKGEERRTNWDKFTTAIWELRKKRQDFEVYFTDPNNALEIGTEVSDWTKTIPKDRNAFLNLLHKTDVIVSLMDVEGFGGISIREGLLFGCRPVIPNIHEYKKMAPKGCPYFIKSPIEVDDLVRALERAIRFGKKNFYRDNWHNLGKQFTVEEQFKSLLPKIEELL